MVKAAAAPVAPEVKADIKATMATPRPRRRPARAAAPAAPAAKAVDVAEAEATQNTPAEIDPPVDGSLFGRYAVRVPDEEPAEVTLRTAARGTALCTCLDFLLSEQADCPHLQALFAHLQADSVRAAALSAGPQIVGSRVVLQQGATRRLLWLPGTECPTALNELAARLLEVEPAMLDDQALPRMLRAARESGHELQVDETVWRHLALARDSRWRVHRLEALLPDGPASPLLSDLLPVSLSTSLSTSQPPLLPLQVEAALFAVCAGRCLLADDAVLQPMLQALAAAELWRRHFGLERVLLLAPGETLDRWRRLLPLDAEGWSLTSIDSVVSDAVLHHSLAPAQ